MTATFKLFIRRLAHGPENPDLHVHFHQGPDGTPAVCQDAGCEMPRLSV